MRSIVLASAVIALAGRMVAPSSGTTAPPAPIIPLMPPRLPSMVTRNEISLPGAILDRYVGEYELAASFHIVVTRGADGLIMEPTGQGKVPAFAESETRFFLKIVDAQISFDVDATGKTTALTLHQNGQNIKGAKIK